MENQDSQYTIENAKIANNRLIFYRGHISSSSSNILLGLVFLYIGLFCSIIEIFKGDVGRGILLIIITILVLSILFLHKWLYRLGRADGESVELFRGNGGEPRYLIHSNNKILKQDVLEPSQIAVEAFRDFTGKYSIAIIRYHVVLRIDDPIITEDSYQETSLALILGDYDIPHITREAQKIHHFLGIKDYPIEVIDEVPPHKLFIRDKKGEFGTRYEILLRTRYQALENVLKYQIIYGKNNFIYVDATLTVSCIVIFTFLFLLVFIFPNWPAASVFAVIGAVAIPLLRRKRSKVFLQQMVEIDLKKGPPPRYCIKYMKEIIKEGEISPSTIAVRTFNGIKGGPDGRKIPGKLLPVTKYHVVLNVDKLPWMLYRIITKDELILQRGKEDKAYAIKQVKRMYHFLLDARVFFS